MDDTVRSIYLGLIALVFVAGGIDLALAFLMRGQKESGGEHRD